jgi:hypothetical protein
MTRWTAFSPSQASLAMRCPRATTHVRLESLVFQETLVDSLAYATLASCLARLSETVREIVGAIVRVCPCSKRHVRAMLAGVTQTTFWRRVSSKHNVQMEMEGGRQEMLDAGRGGLASTRAPSHFSRLRTHAESGCDAAYASADVLRSHCSHVTDANDPTC